MIIIEVDIYTGILEYKGINFSFVFDKQELRLIPPKDKKKKIEHEWFMHKIGEGVYAGGDHPQMEQPFLVGTCNEDGNKMIFITQEGTYIGRYNFVLRIEVIAFLVLRYRECSINKMCFLSPEINCIHSIGQSFCFEYDEDFIEKGIVQLRTNEFSSVTTEAETFECNSKIIKVTFGASRTLSSGVTETPLKLNSSLCFEFVSTEDYAFIYHLWVIAKRFIQYLCYRKNVFFSKVELSTSYKGYKHIKSGELYVLEDLEEHNSEEEVLKKGCYIRQSYITGAVGSILQSIAEDSIYLRHLPQNYEEGHHIDAARFVMITAAFEWEFRRIFPEGIKKKEKKIKAEETVVQLLTPLIENNTGEIKSILKYLKKCVGNDPLSSKLTFVGMELGNIIDIFGKHLYALNGKKLKYSEMGERLAAQRNNFAHGNLDKDFDELALLDLIYLELILYAMQLKFYGVEDVKIKKAINDLFHKNIRIDE